MVEGGNGSASQGVLPGVVNQQRAMPSGAASRVLPAFQVGVQATIPIAGAAVVASARVVKPADSVFLIDD